MIAALDSLNLTLPGDCFAYRLSAMNGGSDKYGNCEVCAKRVDSTYLLTIYHTFDGQGRMCAWNDKFGHKDCLASLTKRA